MTRRKTKLQYRWENQGFGGTLTRLSDGYNVWFQGDDFDIFDREWNRCRNNLQSNLVADSYSDLMEAPEEQE